MQKVATLTKCTHCFKSLGISSKMEIYRFLAKHGKAGVSQIVDVVGLKQPTVSYHLKEMKENGLLYSQKVGKEVLYGVNSECPHYELTCVLHNVHFPLKEQYAEN